MSRTLYVSNCAVYNEVAIQQGQVLLAPVYKYTSNQFEESVLKCVYLDNRTYSYEPTREEIHAKNVLDGASQALTAAIVNKSSTFKSLPAWSRSTVYARVTVMSNKIISSILLPK